MALLDFIELSDDEDIVVSKKKDEEIVDLGSDHETAEESQNDFTCGSPVQHPTALHDGQAVFVAEAGGEATESRNADEATPSSSSVTGKGSLGTAASENLHHTPAAASFPCPTSISTKALTVEACDTNLKKKDEEIVDLSSDHEIAEESQNDFTCGSPVQHPTALHDGHAVFVAEVGGEATESRNADEATRSSSSVTGKGSLGTAASENLHHTPAAVSFPCPTSISTKALTVEACDVNLRGTKVKRRRKLFHTDTPWRSSRLENKNKGRSKSSIELAVDIQKPRMLEEQNTSARSQKKKLSPCSFSNQAPPGSETNGAELCVDETLSGRIRKLPGWLAGHDLGYK